MKPTAVVDEVYVCPNADGKYRATVISDERLSQGEELHLTAALNRAPSAEPVALNDMEAVRVAFENAGIAHPSSLQRHSDVTKAQGWPDAPNCSYWDGKTEQEFRVFQKGWGARANTAPPNLSAAVAAAREQCAQQCEGEYEFEVGEVIADNIRGLQDPDGLAALRKLMMTLAKEVDYCSGQDIEKLVDRVLKGEQA